MYAIIFAVTTPYICLLFWGFSDVCHSACVWPTAWLKLGCVTNFDMLFRTMGIVCLNLINLLSRHTCSTKVSNSANTRIKHTTVKSKPGQIRKWTNCQIRVIHQNILKRRHFEKFNFYKVMYSERASLARSAHLPYRTLKKLQFSN